MNLRTNIKFENRMYLIRTTFNECFHKYVTDIFRADEYGNINEKGEVIRFITAMTKEEARENHINWVLQMSI